MGYRSESEHLRQRVHQLEGELARLRGQWRSDEHPRQASQVSRQTILLMVLAMLASACTLLCALPAVIATVEFPDVQSAAEVAEASSAEECAFEGRADAANTFAYYDAYSEIQWAAPVDGEPRIILACDWRCPPDLAAELRETAGGTAPTRQRMVYGYVSRLGDDAFEAVPRDDLEAHARAHGLSVSDLRLITVRMNNDPRPGLWAIFGLGAFATLLFWLVVLWHRRASRAEAPLPRIEDFTNTDPVVTVMLGIVSCRLYELVWMLQSTARLRRITGRKDLIPAIDFVMTLMTLGLWVLWVYYRNAEAIDELMTESPVPTTVRSTVIGYTLGSLICGLLHWVLVFKFQEALNRVAAERAAMAEV